MRNYGKFFLFSVLLVLMSILVSCNDSQQITEPAALDGGERVLEKGKEVDGENQPVTYDEDEDSIYDFQWEFRNDIREIRGWEYFEAVDGSEGLKTIMTTILNGHSDEYIEHNFTTETEHPYDAKYTWVLNGETLQTGINLTNISFETEEEGEYFLELTVDRYSLEGFIIAKDYFWCFIEVESGQAILP